MFQTLWKPIKCWIQMHHLHHHMVRQSQWCSQSLCNKNRGLCDKSGSRFRSKESQSNAKLLSNSNNEAHCPCRHTQMFCRHVKETTSNTDAPTNEWRVNPMFKLPRTSKGAKFVSLMFARRHYETKNKGFIGHCFQNNCIGSILVICCMAAVLCGLACLLNALFVDQLFGLIFCVWHDLKRQLLSLHSNQH